MIFRRIIKSYLTDGRTDRQTDELIWGGLGNLRFLQVKKIAEIITVYYCAISKPFLIATSFAHGEK